MHGWSWGVFPVKFILAILFTRLEKKCCDLPFYISMKVCFAKALSEEKKRGPHRRHSRKIINVCSFHFQSLFSSSASPFYDLLPGIQRENFVRLWTAPSYHNYACIPTQKKYCVCCSSFLYSYILQVFFQKRKHFCTKKRMCDKKRSSGAFASKNTEYDWCTKNTYSRRRLFPWKKKSRKRESGRDKKYM